MRTAYFVSGIVLLVLGIGLAILAATWIGATCTDDPFMAQVLGIPTCSGLLIQTGAVAFGGLLFAIIGIVLLTKRTEGQVPTQVPPPTPVPTPEPAERFCPKCGTHYGPEADFCHKDGTPLQAPL